MKPVQNYKKDDPREKRTIPDENADNFCDLDPTKICDNCFKCLETDSDYATVEIDGIYMDGERIY